MWDEVTGARIIDYIRTTFLDGDPDGDLARTTPLIELGVLNSLNIVRLLAFVDKELGVKVPPMEVNGANFKSPESIVDVICRHRPS